MSEKIKDEKNRWRSRTVGFRVSPEEWDTIERQVKLCGYQKKQEYIMDCLLHHEVTAVGNPLMLMSFHKELRRIEEKLTQKNSTEEMDLEILEPLRTVCEIMEAFQKEKQ